MSDTTNSPHDAAILVLRERESQLDSEIQTHRRQLEIATARRDELLDLIATLSRKPRVRKPRAVAETANDPGEMPAQAEARPSVFAAPIGEAA